MPERGDGSRSHVSDVPWFIGDQYGKYISSYGPEVGSVELLLDRQPCPSVPKQPTRSVKRRAAAWELCCKGWSLFPSLYAENGQYCPWELCHAGVKHL